MTEWSPPARPTAAPPGRLVLSRRTLLKSAAAVGFGAMISGCVGPVRAADPGGVAGGTLSLTLNRNLVTLDNKLNQYDAALTAQRAVREALTVIADDLTTQPWLAESLEQTEPTRWTGRLREGITYSDGSPVTLEDVGTALEMYFGVEAGYVASQFPEQPGFEAVDDRAFVLTTTQPLASLDSLMSNILITPAVQNTPSDLTLGLGTGPFVIAEADTGTGTWRLERNENYWGEKAALGAVEISYQEEEGARVIAITAGQTDVIDTITPESATSLRTNPDIDVIQIEGTRLIHLFYNFRKPADHPLANPRVREALSHAVDHESLIPALMADGVTSATGVVPATLNGFTETGAYVYDPDLARSMLAEEGVSDLALVFIWEDAEFAGASRVLEAIAQMLAEIGVTVELRMIPRGGEINQWRRGEAGDWDVLANGYGNQTGLAITNLQGQYAGTEEQEATRDSYHGFVFPEVSTLVSEAAGESEETLRNELLAEAQQAVWDRWPALWAWIPATVLAKRDRVQGLDLRAVNSYDVGRVTVTE